MTQNPPSLEPDDPRGIGAYRLLGRLGQGGQGVVYLGQDESGTHCAIKLLHPWLMRDSQVRTRFLRELEAAKSVAEFCTAKILDADVFGERPYIVSEYVEGASLRSVLATEGPRSGGALERLALGTLTALAAIHRAGIVHRDFTPGNVLLGPDGPRVIDFGVARAISHARTENSGDLGTPAYMAPEQVNGDQAVPPTDMFAWAATMVCAANGTPPFGNDTIPAVVNRILHEEPEIGDINEPLRSVVVQCLDKDPARRLSAHDAHARILGIDGASPARAASQTDGTQMKASRTRPPRDGRRSRRRTTLWVAGAAAVAAALAGAGLVFRPWEPPTAIATDAADRPPAATAGVPTASGRPATTRPARSEPKSTPIGRKAKPTASRTGRGPKPSPSRKPGAPQPNPRRSACVDRTGSWAVGENAGGVTVSVRICKNSFSGTATTSDTPGDGWAACVQLNGHHAGTSTGNDGGYTGTAKLSSGNAVRHPFNVSSPQRIDFIYVNLARCRGTGHESNWEWDWQSSKRLDGP